MILFYLLILIMPLENHPIWEHHFGPLTVIKYIGLGCCVAAAFYLPARKGGVPQFLGTWQARLFVLLLFIAIVSYATKGYNERSSFENPLTMYISFLLLYFITITLVDSPRRLRNVLLVAIGSVGFASLYVIREWQRSGFSSEFRPGWVVGDANYFTVSVAACIPIAIYLFIVSRRKGERWYCFACIVPSLFAAWLGASRGGFIALTLSSIWLFWHTRYRWKFIAILALLAVPVLAVSSNSPVRRLFEPTKFDRASSENHWLVLKAGIRMTLANPLFGVGLGQFRRQVLNYADPQLRHAFIAHDAYIEVSSEMGIPALLIYIAMLGFCFTSLSRSHKIAALRGITSLEEAAVGVEAGLIGSSTAVLFVSGEDTKLYWLMIFLSMTLPPLISRYSKIAQKSIAQPQASSAQDFAEAHVPQVMSTTREVGFDDAWTTFKNEEGR